MAQDSVFAIHLIVNYVAIAGKDVPFSNTNENYKRNTTF
jgi:hypothetical protein